MVRYYESPDVVEKFKKQQKDSSPIWVFHGTNPANIPSIMAGGFSVGGKDGPVANGTVPGNGAYSAVGPKTPISYSPGRSIVLAKALLKGKHVRGSGDNSADSWAPHPAGSGHEDWVVFKEAAQVLQVYVLKY